MKLSGYLKKQHITIHLSGSNKPEIITNLVKIMAKNFALRNTKSIIKDLIEREELKTTGIGFGIAIPHCRRPDVKKIHVAIGISKKGLNFDSLDHKPVKIFFLVVGPKRTHSHTGHIKLVASICRLLKDKDVQLSLLETESSREVLSCIKHIEDIKT